MDALHLLEVLGEVGPVDATVLDRSTESFLTTRTASAPRHAAAESAVATSLGKDPSGGGHRAVGARARTRRRRAGSIAAAAVVAGAVVSAGALLSPGSPVGPMPAAAAAVLRHLADVAATQPASVVPGPGQYLYVDSQQANLDRTGGSGASYAVLLPEERQIWIGTDGSGRLRQTYGTPSFLTAKDHAAWVAAGSPALPGGAPMDDSFGPGGLVDGPTDVTKLPTDPSALGIAISRMSSGAPAPAEVFTRIGDLLRETDASPALRAALYRVAAELPGVELLGSVTDHVGRAGIGVAYTAHGTQDELIFDPRTSALLGEQSTVTGAGTGLDVAPGTVVGWAAYLRYAVVDTTGPTPAATTPVPAPAQGSGT